MATETSFDEHIPFPNMEISAVQPHRSVYNTSQFAIDGDLTGTWVFKISYLFYPFGCGFRPGNFHLGRVGEIIEEKCTKF